jgi:hypothetical protein
LTLKNKFAIFLTEGVAAAGMQGLRLFSFINHFTCRVSLESWETENGK